MYETSNIKLFDCFRSFSSQTKHDTTATANTHKNARHSSADSEDLPRSTSKKNQAKQSPRDDEKVQAMFFSFVIQLFLLSSVRHHENQKKNV